MQSIRSGKYSVAIVLALSLAVAACASVSRKERVVQGVSALHQVLAAAQDAEMSLYASGTVPQLTEAKHKQFHGALVKAFDAEIKLATALKSWRAGDPPPASAAEVVQLANEALAVVRDLAPDRAASVLTAVQQWLDTAVALQQLFLGGDQWAS